MGVDLGLRLHNTSGDGVPDSMLLVQVLDGQRSVLGQVSALTHAPLPRILLPDVLFVRY